MWYVVGVGRGRVCVVGVGRGSVRECEGKQVVCKGGCVHHMHRAEKDTSNHKSPSTVCTLYPCILAAGLETNDPHALGFVQK